MKYKIGQCIFAVITEGLNGEGEIIEIITREIIDYYDSCDDEYGYKIKNKETVFLEKRRRKYNSQNQRFHQNWVKKVPFMEKHISTINNLVKETKFKQIWNKLKLEKKYGIMERVIFT